MEEGREVNISEYYKTGHYKGKNLHFWINLLKTHKKQDDNNYTAL